MSYRAVVNDRKPSLRFDSSIFETTKEYKIGIVNAKSKIYYDILLEDKFQKPTSLIKWINEYEVSEKMFIDSIV